MDANTLRRLNWLWKHRHTHTGNELTEVERRLIVVEEQADKTAGTSSGAYIHLGDAAGQEIDDGGEAVTFTSILKTPLNFTATTPTDEVVIQVPGYYDAQIELEWESYTGGGSVWVTRTRSGDTETVWPPSGQAETATNGRMFVDNMAALNCRPGDVLQLWVDPVAGSAKTLRRAVFVPRLLDRSPRQVDPAPVIPDVDVAGATFQQFGQSSYNQPLPDCQADDLLVMILSHGAGSAITTPDGWSVLDSDTQSGGRVTIITRTADGSEGDTQTVSMGASGGQSGVTIRFRGSPETPSVDLQYAGTSNPRSFPTGTPLHGNGDYWVVPFSTGFEAGSPSVLPDGYPEIAYPTTPNPTAWERVWVGAAFETVTGSVSVDPISWTNDGWNQVWTGVLLVKGG